MVDGSAVSIRLTHLAFEAIHLLQVAHDLRRLLEVERFLTAEWIATTQIVHGPRFFEVRGQHGELVAQARVLHE
jgi:hypothetical protein